jgi:hypothetical protein
MNGRRAGPEHTAESSPERQNSGIMEQIASVARKDRQMVSSA